MEFIFNLLGQLAKSLSITEFVLVLSLIAAICVMLLKTFLKFTGKRNLINNILRDDCTDNISAFTNKLNEVVTESHYNETMDKILHSIDQLRVQSIENHDFMRTQITDILLLKRDVEALNQTISKDLNELRHELKLLETHNHKISEDTRDILIRLQDSMLRLLSMLDKIDEFARAAIPEFRSYHMELTKDVRELNRDIALVERTIQTQINTSNTNAVNLK